MNGEKTGDDLIVAVDLRLAWEWYDVSARNSDFKYGGGSYMWGAAGATLAMEPIMSIVNRIAGESELSDAHTTM